MTAAFHLNALLSRLSQDLSKPITDYLDQALSNSTFGDMTVDSRTVKPNDIFVAISGHSTDGRLYIADAFEKGASLCLTDVLTSEHKSSLEKYRHAILEVDKLRQKLSFLAAEYYGHPGKRLQSFGATGTNGKTSVCHFFTQLCQLLGKKSAFVGTIGSGVPGKLNASALTTPDPIEIQRLLRQFVETETDYCAMEVSSHALSQFRVDAADIKVAAFINLSHDHLDYHGSLESYYQAKKRLFQLPSIRHAIINVDDLFGQRLLQELRLESDALLWTVSAKDVDPEVCIDPRYHLQLLIKKVRQEAPSQWICRFDGSEIETSSTLIGDFNISNVLMSVLSLYAFGEWTMESILKKVAVLRPPPGRLECMVLPNRARVFIDYAHTPDALEKVILALKPEVAGRIIVVFGCGGERDKAKRPAMGRIAQQLSDHCIVTDDNPRREDSKQIIDEICAGCASNENVTIEPDRKSAIHRAILMATSGDVVLVAGKGHEDYQLIGETKKSYSDRDVVQAFIKESRCG